MSGRHSHGPVDVLPLSSLDERYLTSTAIWEAVRPVATIVVAGPLARTAAGELDMAPITGLIESLVAAFPRLRRKIMPSLFGLHAPAWVPDASFDINRHIRRYPGTVDIQAIPPRLLAGEENGPMDRRRPPWDVLVAELTDGGIALVLRWQHVLGDGLFGRAMVVELLGSTRKAATARAPVEAKRAPRNGIALMLASARTFRREYPTVTTAWQEFVRTPPTRRLRRVVARNIRPIRDQVSRRRGDGFSPLDREPRLITMNLPTVRSFARTSGGNVGDFTAAVLAAALTSLAPDRGPIGVLVPISGRIRGDDPAGNQVKVIRVELPATSDLAALTSAAAQQVSAALERDDFPPLAPGSWDGYASYLPGPPRTPIMLGRPVTSVMAWPAMDPAERCAILAGSVAGKLELCLLVGRGVDADTLVAAIKRLAAQQAGVAA